MSKIEDLPPKTPYEEAKPHLDAYRELLDSDWRYHLAYLYILRDTGHGGSDANLSISAYEAGMHRRQHGE